MVNRTRPATGRRTVDDLILEAEFLVAAESLLVAIETVKAWIAELDPKEPKS